EASWRWRMMMPSTDRSYELFWRQTTRWLASAAPDPVAVTTPEAAEPCDAVEIDVDVRDALFQPAPDAVVEATLTSPGGEQAPLPLRRDPATSGRLTAAFRPEKPGLYRVKAEGRRGAPTLGMASPWFHGGWAYRG